MNIQEFDENVALLHKLKNNILVLLNKVQDEEKSDRRRRSSPFSARSILIFSTTRWIR